MVLKIPEQVRAVLERLESGGFSAFCVGGCIRDGLLGRSAEDWDVTTSALPEEGMAIFGERAFPTGLKHGTVTVRMDGMAVEVTTFRTDGPYFDGRHPSSVSFTRSLEEDLARRDFTVNAMAMDLSGNLTDPFHGQSDLADRILRCVGNPDRRFGEDALRILRCLRFAAVLGFTPEQETEESLRCSRSLLHLIAAERIREELTRLLCAPGAAEVLRAFPEVIGEVIPELTPMMGFDQRNCHHCYDVWEHTLWALQAGDPAPLIRWALLLHDIGKPETFTVDSGGNGHFYGHPIVSRRLAETVLRRLRFDNAGREAILTLVEWHDRNIPRTDRGVRRALCRLGEERLRQLLAVKRADNLGQAPEYRNRQDEIDCLEQILDRLLTEQTCFSLRQLAVNGMDMVALGLKGPEIGQALEELLDLVVDEQLPNEKKMLLAHAAAARTAR